MCCAVSFSHVQLFDTPWTVACQVPMSILQARILEWVACPFSRGSSWPRNPTGVSCIAGWFFTSWVTREAHYKWIHTHTHTHTHLFIPGFIKVYIFTPYSDEWNLPLDILSISCIWNEFETLSGSTVNMLTRHIIMHVWQNFINTSVQWSGQLFPLYTKLSYWTNFSWNLLFSEFAFVAPVVTSSWGWKAFFLNLLTTDKRLNMGKTEKST